MRTLTRAGLVAGAAVALALVPAGQALAADGVFLYQNVNGDELVIENPQNDECYLLVSGMEWGFNETSAVAFVYADHGCEGPSFMVFPGTTTSYPEPVPHSVVFR